MLFLERTFFPCLTCLFSLIEVKNTPNPMMTIPPTWFNPFYIISPADVDSTLLIITPNVEKTTENPKTKNIEFRIMFVLLIDIVLEPLCFDLILKVWFLKYMLKMLES